MPQGICKMCLRPKELIRSHLIPRAVYSLCRTADSEPVKFNKEVIMQTSRQTQDYLLCAVCDNSLSEHGENWVLPKLKTWDKGFPLYDLLAGGKPGTDGTDPNFSAAKLGKRPVCPRVIPPGYPPGLSPRVIPTRL